MVAPLRAVICLLTLLVWFTALPTLGQVGATSSLVGSGWQFVVEDVRVSGLQRVSIGNFFDSLPIANGDRIDSTRLRFAAKNSFKLVIMKICSFSVGVLSWSFPLWSDLPLTALTFLETAPFPPKHCWRR